MKVLNMPEKIQIRNTSRIGRGVFANKDFMKNEFLFIFEGNVLSLQEIHFRNTKTLFLIFYRNLI